MGLVVRLISLGKQPWGSSPNSHESAPLRPAVVGVGWVGQTADCIDSVIARMRPNAVREDQLSKGMV